MNMWGRAFLAVALLAATAFAIDHETFKNCSRVEFCTKLRTATPDAKSEFKADIDSLDIFDGVAKIDVTNENGDELVLAISALNDNKFRVIIEEKDGKRYRLTHSLDGEPQLSRLISVNTDSSSITLAESADADNVVKVISSPMAVEFYRSGILVQTFEGSRLIIENTKDSQAFAFSVNFPKTLRVYGIHEHADHLALRTTSPNGDDPYRLRNLDAAYYELHSTMSLYGAVPVLYGHGTEGTSGFFLHNAAEQWWEISNGVNNVTAYVMTESGLLDVFVLLGPTPVEVVRQYANLTGVAHLPQLWTLGYHQCRWNYDNTSDVAYVVDNFDLNDFPLDVMWLDIEYTDAKKYFTWNPENFSDAIGMQDHLASTNRKLVVISDPHIKVDPDFSVYQQALEKDLYVKWANGSVYEADCWPGLSSFIDYLNPKAIEYYASLHHYENFPNTTETLAGIWNDMNEPAVFGDDIEKTFPGDALHYGGVKHKDVHNIYGLLQTKATHKGLYDRDQGQKRPFVLTRSHFSGSQRYTALWTGDNTADWGYLAISYSQCLTANIVGLSFCGSDVGGFFDSPTEELFQRWYQAGVWLPFYRAHANMGTDRREPYLFPEDVQKNIRESLRLRYKHIPYWYTLFYEHTLNKDPVIRPLFYQYPEDPNVVDIDNQLLVGSNILVRAVTEPGVTEVETYFPGEEYWYSIYDGSVVTGGVKLNISTNLSSIPVYYRSGSIIPRKETPRRNTVEQLEDPYTITINLDANKKAGGKLYVDDFTSFNYLKGEFDYIDLEYSAEKLLVSPMGKDTLRSTLKIDCIIVNEIDTPGKYKQTVYKKQNRKIEEITGKVVIDLNDFVAQ